MYPIVVELLCEMSFPVGEAVAGSFFYILSQLFGAGEVIDFRISEVIMCIEFSCGCNIGQ